MRIRNTLAVLLLVVGAGKSQTRNITVASIEPDARLWQPWLLASASEIRPDRPPAREETVRELLAVQTAVGDPSPETAARVAYWSAGSPNYRWQQITMA